MKEKLEDLTYRLASDDDFIEPTDRDDTLVLADQKNAQWSYVICEAADDVCGSTSGEMAERIVACLNFFKGIETSTVLALSQSQPLVFLARAAADLIESNSK